jgi:four helix bundle protein
MYESVKEWSSFDRWSIGVQLVRAADSVGANIAEAVGRWHPKDKRRLLLIARASLYEVEHWLLRARARGLAVVAPDEQLDELGRTLGGLVRRPVPSSDN